MKTQTFSVTEMTCDGCVNAVQNAINALNGIGQVLVNRAEQIATVEYDDTIVQPQAIINAIEEAGYDAALKISA